MTDDHPNALAYLRTADAFRARDDAALAELIAPDIVWHVPGQHLMSGDIRGRDELTSWFRRLRPKGFWLTEHDVFGNDEHVCALSIMGARRPGVDVQTRATPMEQNRPVTTHASTIWGISMNLREVQKPLKDGYRAHPESSKITLVARGGQGDAPIACSVDLGRAIYDAQAHAGVGGAGTGACSGDLLLGALAACAQVTCQMVAASMELPTEEIHVTVEGDLDLAGTLGIGDARVGFESIRLSFDIVAPNATQAQLDLLIEKTMRYCVVLQTLQAPPTIETRVISASRASS